MENKLRLLKDAVMRQVNSYKENPSEGDFDRGYKCGMMFVLGEIGKLNKQFATQTQPEAKK